MILRNVPGPEVIEEAAAAIGVEVDGPTREGRGWRFRLRLADLPRNGPPYVRVGRHGLIAAVCWHGFRDFLRYVFERYPEAVAITAIARYEGKAGFERDYPATGDRNIGSVICPVLYRDACRCSDTVRGGDRGDRDVRFSVRTLKQSHLLACPHVIIAAEHYREDGTCRCDDPTHTQMAEWQYTWNEDTRRWE